MSARPGLLVTIRRKRERIIAKVGDLVLKERVWSLEPARHEKAQPLKISRQKLLPPYSRSDYLTTREVHEETELTMRALQALARKGTVEAMKVSGRWLLLRESLNEHLRRSGRSLVLPSTRSDYLTTREAHEEMGLTIRALQALAREGTVEATKVGGRWLLRRESLYEHLYGS